jgi:hypothetical protein
MHNMLVEIDLSIARANSFSLGGATLASRLSPGGPAAPAATFFLQIMHTFSDRHRFCS